MYARVITIEAPPEQRQEMAESVRRHIIPRLRQTPGFLRAHWLGSLEGLEKGFVIVMFENAESGRAFERQILAARLEAAGRMGIREVANEEFEVYAEA